MKQIKVLIAMVSFLSINMVHASDSCDAQIALQMHQLKHMLIKSNQAYINYTTPMYDQWLTLHWFTQYFIPWRALQSGNAYNAEIILKESKQLAVIIAAIEQIQASKK